MLLPPSQRKKKKEFLDYEANDAAVLGIAKNAGLLADLTQKFQSNVDLATVNLRQALATASTMGMPSTVLDLLVNSIGNLEAAREFEKQY